MKAEWTRWLAALGLCLAPLTSPAETSVWRVSEGDSHLYLGGTIHILSQQDFPLPVAFEHAYEQAGMVVLEANLDEMETLKFQRDLLLKTTYSGKDHIGRHLSDTTVSLLRQHLEQRDIPPASVFRFRPGMLSVTLTVLELQRLGFTEAGVDEYFRLRAVNDGKSLAYLESTQSQIDFLINMGKGQEDELIQHTLLEMKELPGYMDGLRSAWRAGDTRALEAIGLDSWATQFPDLHQTLLVDRNRDWIPRIEQLLETEEVELVLFGALHLVGDNGVLNLLQDRGLDVEQVTP